MLSWDGVSTNIYRYYDLSIKIRPHLFYHRTKLTCRKGTHRLQHPPETQKGQQAISPCPLRSMCSALFGDFYNNNSYDQSLLLFPLLWLFELLMFVPLQATFPPLVDEDVVAQTIPSKEDDVMFFACPKGVV